MVNIFLVYYFFINLVAFFIMGIDKRKAIMDKWRIKENTLFVLSLIGGFIGFYAGMHVFHHKTKKMKFHICFYVSLVMHIAILYFLFFR